MLTFLLFRKGMRFVRERMRFEITEEGLAEDEENKGKETVNARMARICLPAMNAVNEDLVFTVEIPEDFPNNRLPTLDFLFWFENFLRKVDEDTLHDNEQQCNGGPAEGLHPS